MEGERKMDESGKKERKSGKNGSPGLKARFRYWFDSRMANGSVIARIDVT